MTARIENLDLAGPAGRLEALLNTPPGAIERVAVVCHPHPLYGGTMHNNVVYHTARSLRERGMAVLRFNFRGVGRSEGAYDGGRGEMDDARAALDALMARFPATPCWMAGFSFGSWVGLQVGMQSPAVQALLAVGMPVDSHDFAFLQTCSVPLAVVQGGGDEFGAEQSLRTLIAGLPCRARVEMVPEAGHFFPRRFDDLRAAVGRAADFLELEVSARGA